MQENFHVVLIADKTVEYHITMITVDGIRAADIFGSIYLIII